jgi:hypothetical protein
MYTLTVIVRVLLLLDTLNKTSSVYGLEKQNYLHYVKLLDSTELLTESRELYVSNLKACNLNLKKILLVHT